MIALWMSAMMEHLQKLCDLSVLVFVASSMLTMGLSQRPADVLAPLRSPKPVLMALLVNFVLAPLLALALCHLIPLRPPHAIGLLILGGAAGAPFLPKLAEVARGNLAYSISLMALLMLVSIVYVPIVLPLMIPGLQADPWGMAKPLLLLMMAPMVLGFALARVGASRIKPLLTLAQRVSNVSLLLLVVLLVGLNIKTMAAAFGSFAMATYALFVFVMVVAGYLLGGPDRSTKAVSGLGAGQRNIPAGLLVASASFDDPSVQVMVILATIAGFVVLLAFAVFIRRRTAIR
jgi:bile acid:Na+ symporter, BASS family